MWDGSPEARGILKWIYLPAYAKENKHETAISQKPANMKSLFYFYLAPVILGTAQWSYAASIPDVSLSSIVTLQDGTIQGNPRDTNGVISFKGIPYAEPPVNELRWKSPLPAKSWKATLNATNFGATCWGGPGLNAMDSNGIATQSEDCLTVNIWTPANTTTQKLPVMVWIYGGGFQFGSSVDPKYDGSTLATKEVIVVSFNYRASTLGFLALSALDDEAGGSPSGNYGLQDMILALKWVQANIQAFGGDPERVTIFGESAGAHAVGLLMASPLAKDESLFSRAICESGAYWDYAYGSLQTFHEARQLGRELQKTLGVHSLTQLRGLSPDKLVSAMPYNPEQPKPTLFGPSIDGYVLPTAPAEVFALGSQAKVPLIAGFNAGEGVVFAPEGFPHDTPRHFQNAARRWFGNQSLPTFSEQYPSSTESQTNISAITLIGDMSIREQTWEAAAAQAKTNSDVYLYYFTYTSPYSPVAVHSGEVPFVFGNLTPSPLAPQVPPSPEDEKFSEMLQSYWTNFAKYADPNSQSCDSGLAQWPKYTGGADGVQLLNATIQPTEIQTGGFEFLKGFRKNGFFPIYWHGLNVSMVPN